MFNRSRARLLLVAVATASIQVACGSSSTSDTGTSGSKFSGGDASVSDASQTNAVEAGAPKVDSGPGIIIGSTASVTGISITPGPVTVTSLNGAAGTQAFKVTAKYSDGTTQPLTTGLTWTTDSPLIGSIDTLGNYTANGSMGAVVGVTATYAKLSAKAAVTVKLLLKTNAPSVPAGTQTALQTTTTKDTSVVWAYPYDGTVFPRGLIAPTLQWNGGAATDDYYVHITSPTFELQQYSVATGAPSSQLVIDAATWTKFSDSTSGDATITVNRWNGTAATQISTSTWTISPASMRGTIYYWSNNLGRVLRIKPGASAPDDFSAGTLGALPTASCTMTCHTVSADGSTIISGGDALGGSFDLIKNQVIYDLGGTPGSPQKRAWSNAALSSNGKYMVQNGNTSVPGPPGAVDGMWKTADGTRVTGSGLDGLHLGSPSFSADGTKLAYIALTGADPGSLNVFGFNLAAATVGATTDLVSVGTGQPPQWPSVSPDANWIVYHRGVLDTRTGSGDLYLANANTPNQEIRLAKVDGDTYPFAAGSRDLSLNYEPTFAPVPSGGYFWVVFTSRRTYGNILTGASTVTKQLWVAAIDQNPKPGVDPSHAAFHLEGQDETNMAMRGFWSLPPCASNGSTCATGTDCCGGYCAAGADGGPLTCESVPTTGCSQNGDKCTTTGDCCNASAGVSCIAHVCSEPTPQ